MQLAAVFRALRYILLVFLCLALLFAAPCSCNLLCFGGTQNQGLLVHPVRKHIDDNDPSSATMAAATMAQLSPVVFRGTLLSVLVQRDGTVRATFSVDQSMKNDTGEGRSISLDAGQLEVVYLQRSTTGDSCAFDVNEENLRLGSSYVVFGRSGDGAASVFATAFPLPYEKKTFRAIRKITCKGCARPPRVEGLKNTRVVEKGKLRLQCHLSGNPIPWVTWYKDGQPISGSGRVRVRTKRRTSRLTIRQVRWKDRGVYECRAVNIVQQTPASAKAIVAVTKKQTTKRPQKPLSTTTTAASSLWPIESCPNSEFCLNGGTCVFYKHVGEYVCHCADGFVGHRCDFKDVRASMGGVKILEEAHNRLFITVVVLFIVLSCLNWGCFAACWLCCFRNKRYNWKNAREMASLFIRDTRWTERVSLHDIEKERVDLNSEGEGFDDEVADDSFGHPGGESNSHSNDQKTIAAEKEERAVKHTENDNISLNKHLITSVNTE